MLNYQPKARVKQDASVRKSWGKEKKKGVFLDDLTVQLRKIGLKTANVKERCKLIFKYNQRYRSEDKSIQNNNVSSHHNE